MFAFAVELVGRPASKPCSDSSEKAGEGEFTWRARLLCECLALLTDLPGGLVARQGGPKSLPELRKCFPTADNRLCCSRRSGNDTTELTEWADLPPSNAETASRNTQPLELVSLWACSDKRSHVVQLQQSATKSASAYLPPFILSRSSAAA